MKKYLKILIFISLFLFTIYYTYNIRAVIDDELYNYGFAKSILDGLIPYKDFNMIIPPLFHYILAIFLKILGQKLIVYHILIALIITIITYISYKTIGKSSFIIYFLLLVYPYIGYNTFSLLLLLILLNIKNKKYQDILETIIICMMILTKQTLVLLIIPNLIYSKNKIKNIIIYLIAASIFSVYLLINNNLLDFINYCILGLFDFGHKNSTSFNFLLIMEIIIIIFLIYSSYKTKRKDIFYCLMFQIITFPIVNWIHFIISFIPCVYLFLKRFKNNNYIFWFSSIMAISFFIGFNLAIIIKNKPYLDNYPKEGFMKERLSNRIMNSYIDKIDENLKKYKEYTPYILGNNSYLIKLNLEMSINKYDNINDGNMGYKGKEKYLKEIDDYCKENKCLFVINDFEKEVSKTIQTNEEILNYVKKNYKKTYSSNIFSIYIN